MSRSHDYTPQRMFSLNLTCYIQSISKMSRLRQWMVSTIVSLDQPVNYRFNFYCQFGKAHARGICGFHSSSLTDQLLCADA